MRGESYAHAIHAALTFFQPLLSPSFPPSPTYLPTYLPTAGGLPDLGPTALPARPALVPEGVRGGGDQSTQAPGDRGGERARLDGGR